MWRPLFSSLMLISKITPSMATLNSSSIIVSIGLIFSTWIGFPIWHFSTLLPLLSCCFAFSAFIFSIFSVASLALCWSSSWICASNEARSSSLFESSVSNITLSISKPHFWNAFTKLPLHTLSKWFLSISFEVITFKTLPDIIKRFCLSWPFTFGDKAVCSIQCPKYLITCSSWFDVFWIVKCQSTCAISLNSSLIAWVKIK